MKTIHRRGLDSQAVVRRYSLKSGALKNFTNFTGKQLLELFFNKIAGLQARGVQHFSKETPWRSPWSHQRRWFPVKFAKNSSGCFSILILKIVYVLYSVLCNFHN